MKHIGSILVMALAASGVIAQSAVLSYEDGHSAFVSLPEALAEGVPAGLSHAWVWSEEMAPRRFAAAELAAPELAKSRDRLAIQVVAGEDSQDGDLFVLAAPVEMWEEIPEGLMPIWPVPANGRLTVASDRRHAWRLRVTGRDRGTWWVDLPIGQRRIRLEPRRADDRSIDIADSENRLLAEASLTVLARTPSGGRVLAQARSDAEGSIVVPTLPDAAEVELIVNGDGHAPLTLTAWPSAWPGILRLPPGAEIRGRFVDAEGQPLAGVEVQAEAWIDDKSSARVTRHASSDAKGQWALAALPLREVGLLASRQGFAPFSTRLELDGAKDLGIVELSASAELSVRIVDDEGYPVPGALLRAGRGRQATTQRNGRAQLAGLDADEPLTLAVESEGHLSRKVDVASPWPPELSISLQRAFQIAGRYLDQDGTPVSAATARLEIGTRSFERPLRGDGTFTIDLPPSREARLVLQSASTRELSLSLEPGAGGQLRDLGDLMAPPGVRLRGRLLRGSDMTPVAGATIWTPRPSPRGDIVAWAQQDLVTSTSRQDGTFELVGLPRSPVLLRIEARSLARAHLAVEPDDWDIDLGDTLMHEGSRLEIVTGIDAEGSEARVDVRNSWLELDMLTATVTSEGRAIVPHVPPGLATVSVVAGRKLICEEQLEVPADAEPVALDCQRDRMQVSGTVIAGNRPAGAGTLSWVSETTADVPGIILNQESPLGLRQQRAYGAGPPQVDVPVNTDGTFHTDELRSGTWRVSWLPTSGSMTAAETIEIPATREHQVRLEFGGLALHGWVLDAQDRPIERARVQVAGSSDLAFSQADGSFTLVGLEPGALQIYARRDHLRSQVAEAVIEPDRDPEPIVLVLDEEPEQEIEVLVLGDDGDPLPGAFVFLERDDNQTRMLTTDLAGRIAVNLRPPEPAWLRLARMSDGEWTFGDWLSVEKAREGITLAAQRTGALLISSRALQGLTSIFSSEGWDLSWLLTRLGSRPVISPDLALEIQGIPEGAYRLALGDFSTEIAVKSGDLTTIELP